jgi:alcohol dehydrogenase (cytochrome c)
MRRVLIHAPLVIALVGIATLPSPTAQKPEFVPVTDAALRNPAAGDWLRWRRDNSATGYSPLTQVDQRNVQRLRLAWTWAMQPGMQEPEPIVYNRVMYLPHTSGVVQALDARTGALIWEHRRALPKDAGGTGSVRNLAIYQDKIFMTTQDAHLVALEATTGKAVWDVEVGDYKKRVDYSTGPIAGDGRVYAGLTCGGPTKGCAVTAHDVQTGKELWRRESIAGPNDPPEHQATWGDVPYEGRKKVSFWLTGSYDPDLKWLYWTTASSQPYPEILRGSGDGAILYSNSILAIDSATGAIKWFFQMQPRDNFDMDHQDNPILADVTIDGATRKLVYVLGKPGILWAFDRQTGQFVWSRQLVTHQNIYKDIDQKTGAITKNDEIIPKAIGVKQLVCPGMRGGKLFQSHSYNPRTNALYSPVSNACTNFEVVPLEVNASGVNWDKMEHMPGSNGNVGRLAAVSAATGKVLWTFDQRAALGSVLTTGGGLVFIGDLYRYFRALSADTGKVLWETPLSGPVTGYPVSYAVDGKQYIAVGVGGATAGQRQLAQLYPELKSASGSNVLMVFTVDQVASSSEH